MRILVADDDSTSRRILASIVRKWGFDPLVVEDGDAAWAALQGQDAPLLALLDWNMPGKSGFQICELVRQSKFATAPYLILVTARGEKQDVVAGLEAGANDYVPKPYDVDELRARISVGRRMIEMQQTLLAMRDEMAFLASHDPLTGLFNRRAIQERLAQELSRASRESRHLCVAMCDIDHFKKTNDTYGHEAGDAALVAVANVLRTGLRDYDCVGRWGGEEFLVFAPGIQDPSQLGLFDRLLAGVSGLVLESDGKQFGLTISIGVACGGTKEELNDVVSRADAQMYLAKERGRNRVEHQTC